MAYIAQAAADAAAAAGQRLAYGRSSPLSLYSSGLSPRPGIVLRIRQLELWTVQCFGQSDLRTPAIRPCLRGSDFTALVAHPKTYSVQSGGPGPPSSSQQ